MDKLENIVKQIFQPILLEEMESVKLMDRTDTKFLFHLSNLENVLSQLASNYRVLSINQKSLLQYNTLYYDTETYHLYLQHHNGKLNRHKIRHRTYVDSNLGYLEVKFKNNKGRTFKSRIKESSIPIEFNDRATKFLETKLPFLPKILMPKIWVNYKRITLVNLTNGERVTIDTNLVFDDRKGKIISMDNLVIAEVKQDKKQMAVFLNVMKNMHIRRGSISKYCMAVAYLNQDLKRNSFKEKLNHVNKIISNDPTKPIIAG